MVAMLFTVTAKNATSSTHAITTVNRDRRFDCIHCCISLSTMISGTLLSAYVL